MARTRVSVFELVWWSEVKSLISSTNALTDPFVGKFPVGSGRERPCELELYTFSRGLHMCTHDAVPSHDPCPEPQYGDEGEYPFESDDIPCDVSGKY